ncbi:uncharacterized protein LOC117153297 isoform X1 [Bombus vancouverensis nearcticus]|uniref:uncharacterized protein LOC117153297 isoform X1 n=1 Tax=Bombus vancouverensis nearcticus TaxID=2705178 RepID=UPI00143A1261|nr:uncharacterized protein LOC117153297 isoform X1 [Bombus vancouverensis nearcticus]XP_033183097.1 uncharacterized protein LOC117153297 isoform X1 [Bombus vancouverensis nearcticus]XP_033183098.1 uncharacterized protein LOC117153297 isoform X1 [Bombus vancouverensis nearcticus]
MAEGGIKPKRSNIQVSKFQLEVNECLGNWLVYLQTLNGLCTAGTKLAQSLQTLLSAHDTLTQCRLTGQCLAGWEELTRATCIASNTVKNHVISALRDHETRENEGHKHDILRDNLLSFINLQYQFCVACCECLGGMAECSCSQNGTTECDIASLQQCFERLYSSQPLVSSSSMQQSVQNFRRSPLPYPLFPLQVQRRWSETAAVEMSGGVLGNTMRRWSMPWDCRNNTGWPRQDIMSQLRIPHQNRSRSTTPDAIWKASTMASHDGLQEAIQLLSCKPGIRPLNKLIAYTNQQIPGVTLTACNFESNYDSIMWPASRKSGFPRYWPRGSHSSDHSDQSGHRESDQSAHSGEHRDSEQSGTSGSHRDSKDSIHSHSDHREIEFGTVDTLSLRKSSSSTDSCISAYSRSGSESAGGGECARSQLYSMWSGSDLPFIKLPESNETQDEHPPV